MRRGLASLIMGLSLIVATASWAGFTLSRTILDPGSSERLADQLLDSPQVRDALVSRLTDELADRLFDTVPVPDSVIEASAEQVIDDPRIDDLLLDGFVQAHQNALAGESEPVVVDAGILAEVGRDRLVAANPDVAGEVLPSAQVEVELPTAGLSWLGRIKTFVDRWTLIAAVGAALGGILAFVVARDRAPVLRRVAFWAFGVAGFWLLMGYALPWVAGLISPTSSAVASALIEVFFGAMIGPAVAMAVFGAILLGASLLWPIFGGRRGAEVLQPGRARRSVIPAGGSVPALGREPGRPLDLRHEPTARRPAQVPPMAAPPPATTPIPARPAPAPSTGATPVGSGPPPNRWQPEGSTEPTRTMPEPVDLRDGSTTVWEPGRGYVDEQATGPGLDREDEPATIRWDDESSSDSGDDPAGGESRPATQLWDDRGP